MAHQHTLLIVEDDTDIREGMTALFETKGHVAVSAASGRDALAILRNGLRPCAILLDFAMQDLSGAAFRQAQVADEALARIPVIVVSGRDGDTEAEAHALGIRTFLRKPMQIDALFQAVEEHCDRGT
jgi:CheY-like chemotaxis protein